jgi:predicted RNA-binding Zn ribbon-like protein
VRRQASGSAGIRRRPGPAGVDPASAVELASAARASYPNLVAAVAVAVAGSAASGTWLRFKSCSAAHCGEAFYDESGSAAARHCSAHASSL